MRRLIALSALPATLALVLVAEIVQPIVPQTERPLPSIVRPKPPASPTVAADIKVDDLVVLVLERPLMEPTRRAAGLVPMAQAAGAAAPRLSGVIIGPDGKRAIFAPATGRALVLAEGERVGRSVIKAILPDEVILTGSEGDQVIRLRHSNVAPTKNLPRAGSGK